VPKGPDIVKHIASIYNRDLSRARTRFWHIVKHIASIYNMPHKAVVCVKRDLVCVKRDLACVKRDLAFTTCLIKLTLL